MHPTIEQIWYCKGLPRPNVFGRWRRELWEQVGPRLDELERENAELKAKLAAIEQPTKPDASDFGNASVGIPSLNVPIKRGPGRPRKHPVEVSA